MATKKTGSAAKGKKAPGAKTKPMTVYGRPTSKINTKKSMKKDTPAKKAAKGSRAGGGGGGGG